MNTLLAVSDKIFSVKLATELSKECSKIDRVTSALEAHHYMKKNDYQLVILDKDLPDLNGILIAQRILEEEEGIKIVILSFDNEKMKFDNVSTADIIQLSTSDCQKGFINKLKEKKILV